MIYLTCPIHPSCIPLHQASHASNSHQLDNIIFYSYMHIHVYVEVVVRFVQACVRDTLTVNLYAWSTDCVHGVITHCINSVPSF